MCLYMIRKMVAAICFRGLGARSLVPAGVRASVLSSPRFASTARMPAWCPLTPECGCPLVVESWCPSHRDLLPWLGCPPGVPICSSAVARYFSSLAAQVAAICVRGSGPRLVCAHARALLPVRLHNMFYFTIYGTIRCMQRTNTLWLYALIYVFNKALYYILRGLQTRMFIASYEHHRSCISGRLALP